MLLADESTSSQEPQMLRASRNVGKRASLQSSGDPRRWMMLHAKEKGRTRALSPWVFCPVRLEGNRGHPFLILHLRTNLALSTDARESWKAFKTMKMRIFLPHALPWALSPSVKMWGMEGAWEERCFPGCCSQSSETWSFNLQAQGAHQYNQWTVIKFLWLKPGGRLWNLYLRGIL